MDNGMNKSTTIEFLSSLYKNMKMGSDSIIDISSKVKEGKLRDELAAKVGLPSGMTANALLEALKILISYEEYLALVGRDKE